MANYTVAILSVVVALVSGQLLEMYLQSMPYVSLLLCAVMLSAWFGGLGPGLLATTLSTLGFTFLFVSPTHSFDVGPEGAPRIILLSVASLFVVWLNVTRRGAEVELLRSQAYLTEAQRLSQTGSFGWKMASGDIVWSKQTYRIFEVAETVKPTIDLFLQRVHPEDREFVQREIDQATRDARDLDFECRLLMPSGAIKHLHVRAHHRAKNKSLEEEIVGALMDVTAERQAQEALQTAQAELARASRVTTFGEMGASIAHEVNQPLAAIVANANASLNWLTRKDPELEEARASVNRIVQDATMASAVIRKIRHLAKRADLEVTQLDMNDVIEDAAALVKQEALNHRVMVRLALVPGLPLVRGDRIQLQQVVVNLAVNGIQAMATVTDRARVLSIRTERHDSDQVLVAVQDVGTGVDPDSLDRLFSAFYTTKPDGMGMGLAICRSIIEAHGGRISAFRNAGPGMTFQFTVFTCAHVP
jgi:C4-dicarboxylate-specific signal transduction histidine kinase